MALTNFPNGITSFGVPVIGGGPLLLGDGQVFFVDPSSGNDALDGLSPTTAKATSQAAIDLAVDGRGDVIIRLPGGEEVTQTVNFNKGGLTVIAATHGLNPQAKGEFFSTFAAASFTDGPVATVTQECTIDGLAFVSRDAGVLNFEGAAMLIGGLATAAPFGVHIRNCRFPKWALDNRFGISLEGSSDVVIEGCSFEGVGSALVAGIKCHGACTNLTVRYNYFRQCTQAVLLGVHPGTELHLMLHENWVEDGKLLNTNTQANTGLISGNWLETATDTGSYDRTVATLQGVGYNFSGNHYSE